MSANTTYYIRRKVLKSEWVEVSAITEIEAVEFVLQQKDTQGVHEVFHQSHTPDEVVESARRIL